MPRTPSGLSKIERCDYHLSFLFYHPTFPENVRTYHYRALKDMIAKYLIAADDWDSPDLQRLRGPWLNAIRALLNRNSRIQLTLNAEDFIKLKI